MATAMSWGPINAGADSATDLEASFKEAASQYFNEIDFSEDADAAGRAQADAAAAAAGVLAKKLKLPGLVTVTISGHHGDREVPAAVSISLVDLAPLPPPDPVDNEIEALLAENGQN